MPLYNSRAAQPDRLVMAQAATPRVFNMDREVANGSITLVTGRVQLIGFTPPATVSASSLSAFIRGTAAGTITLARYGVYTVAADGSVTLVARTAASTTLGNGTFANANAALDTAGGYPASYTFQQGVRYALACIWVATTQPVVYGAGGTSAAADFLVPWMCAAQTGQTDLQTSIAIGSLTSLSDAPLMAAY